MEDVLKYVYTSKEAAEIWGLSYQTVTQWYNRNRFEENEAKKSGGTILVTHAGMERLAGVTDEEKRMKNVLNREIRNNVKRAAEILYSMGIEAHYPLYTLVVECQRINKELRTKDFADIELEEVKKLHEDTISLLKNVEKER